MLLVIYLISVFHYQVNGCQNKLGIVKHNNSALGRKITQITESKKKFRPQLLADRL